MRFIFSKTENFKLKSDNNSNKKWQFLRLFGLFCPFFMTKFPHHLGKAFLVDHSPIRYAVSVFKVVDDLHAENLSENIDLSSDGPRRNFRRGLIGQVGKKLLSCCAVQLVNDVNHLEEQYEGLLIS